MAVLALAGTCYSLVRLVAGLLAVAICRRRGRSIDDPELTRLLDLLRREMGCRRGVELREAADLTTPATAGWLRPVLLLPDDWRTWSPDECRAVLAHELAHVVRGDYAAGLVARLAVVLNAYHPLVWWTAGRLELQQEQAADALAARFAGGRSSYLVVLARLALEQDGRSPSWPARAFLPARGTLIRRIAMLRDQNESGTTDRPPSGVWRLLAPLPLIGLTIGVGLLHGPTRADGDDAPAGAAKLPDRVANEPIFPPYIRNQDAGVAVFRPAAASRILGEDVVASLVSECIGGDLAAVGKQARVDTSRSEFLKLGCKQIEWIACGLRFGRGRSADRDDLHSVMFNGITLRTEAPFDWLTLLRQWRFEMIEVHAGRRGYYQLKGPLAPILGPGVPCVYLPDDRTIVLDDEDSIRTFAASEAPLRPAYLQSEEWRRASRGLLAVAINNEDGSFAKQYDLGRPDDAIALSLFKGAAYWVLGVDDSAELAMHLEARCQDLATRERITREVEGLLKIGRAAIQDAEAVDGSADAMTIIDRMTKALMANLRIEHTDRTLGLHSQGFGTLADLGLILKAEAKNDQRQNSVAAEGPKSTKR